MDALRRTFSQYHELYQGMTGSQRITLVLVPLMIVGAFAFLMFGDRASSDAALSWGKVFTTEELTLAEQTLREAGLNDFRRDGQRIMVPAKHVDRYNAALLETGNLPMHSASELEKQFEKSGIFTSRDQLRAMKDIALEKELARVIRAVPDIDDATVKWARSEAGGWPRKTKVTATVSVRPRPGRELSRPIVQSLRAAVANMVPDLSPDDVVIFDQSGIAHVPDREGDPFDSRLTQRIREFTREYERQIARALDYIPDVVVAVNVDLEDVKSQTERSTRVLPKETVALSQWDLARTNSSREQGTRGEPGMVPNSPRELRTQGGSDRSQSSSETASQSYSAASFAVSEKEFLAAMPRAVQVSIAIPEEYYRDVALRRGLSDGPSDEEWQAFQKAVEDLRRSEEEKAKATARTLIPSGSPEEAIYVSSIVRIRPEVPETSIPWTATLGHLATQWGSAVGLALFALWALWMLNKSIPKAADDKEAPTPSGLPLPPPTDDEHERDERPLEATARDELQTVVRDDPELAAAVISKWLRTAK